MSTTLKIHYQSPEWDRFKVPRPHIATRVNRIEWMVTGGECGPVMHLLGFSNTPTPGDLVFPDEIADNPDRVVGWYAQFSGTTPSGRTALFGYQVKIERVEVVS